MENNQVPDEGANPRSREPFSDLSNATSSSAPVPNSRPKRKTRSKSKQLEPDPDQNDALTRSEATIVRMSREIATCSSAEPSDLDSVSGDCNYSDISEHATIYKRRNMRIHTTETATRNHTTDATSSASLSCPPSRRKIKQTREKKSKKGDDGVTRRISSSAPCKRRKKQEDFKLPKDYLKEEREYFAKLDEEELLVEEADSE